MCHPETCFRLAWCAVLKNVHFWNMFQIGTVQTLSYRGQTTICLFNHFIWSRPTFVTEKQTKKERNAAWPYFWSIFTNFYASGPCIYHATSIWRSLHGAYLKHVSDMHIFQNGTPCQSETCFRMAHVSERHATHATNVQHMPCVLRPVTKRVSTTSSLIIRSPSNLGNRRSMRTSSRYLIL